MKSVASKDDANILLKFGPTINNSPASQAHSSKIDMISTYAYTIKAFIAMPRTHASQKGTITRHQWF